MTASRLHALGAVLAAGPAFAQAKRVELEDRTTPTPWDLSADAVEDMHVMAGGRKVGEIEKVVGTDRATPVALAVDFDGDAGYGSGGEVAVPPAEFTPADGMPALSGDRAAVAAFPTHDA